jgi:hypothetical protein
LDTGCGGHPWNSSHLDLAARRALLPLLLLHATAAARRSAAAAARRYTPLRCSAAPLLHAAPRLRCSGSISIQIQQQRRAASSSIGELQAAAAASGERQQQRRAALCKLANQA